MGHIPNSVPLRVRITLALAVVVLLAWILVQLITGYTYLPGKHGGALLPGVPTLMFAFASALIVTASLLKIIDHYDRRPNEALYAKWRSRSLRLGGWIYLLTLPYMIVQAVLQIHGVQWVPEFHGLGRSWNLHSPGWRVYGEGLSEHLDFTRWAALAFGSVGLLGWVLMERLDKVFRREGVFLIGVGVMGFGACFAYFVIVDFFIGQVGFRDKLLQAAQHPALFNSVVLTKLIAAFVVTATGVWLAVAAALNRLEPPAR